MNLTTVLEVHVNHFYGVTEPGLPGQQSYVHTGVVPQPAPVLLPVTLEEFLREGAATCKSIVGLAVNLNSGLAANLNVQHFTNLSLDFTALEMLLHAFAELGCIKSLELIYKHSTLLTTVRILGRSFATLVNLSIAGLQPFERALDLQPLRCLTSLSISNMDRSGPLHSIKLPAKLEMFTFFGFSLFLHGTEHNLDRLPCLTKLVLWLPEHVFWVPAMSLGPDAPAVPGAMSSYVDQGWRIPKLPLSLRHFKVQDVGDQFRRCDFDWTGLQGCPYLEHLTLASLQLSGQLTEWVRTARHLYMIDYAYHWGGLERVDTSAITDRLLELDIDEMPVL